MSHGRWDEYKAPERVCFEGSRHGGKLESETQLALNSRVEGSDIQENFGKVCQEDMKTKRPDKPVV